MPVEKSLSADVARISLNGKPCEIRGSICIAEALQQWGYETDTVAVAVNDRFVPRSSYHHSHLSHGDRVEIVAPCQGG